METGLVSPTSLFTVLSIFVLLILWVQDLILDLLNRAGPRVVGRVCMQIVFISDIPLTNRVRGPYRKLRTEFFPPRFMAPARSARAINRRGKNEDP